MKKILIYLYTRSYYISNPDLLMKPSIRVLNNLEAYKEVKSKFADDENRNIESRSITDRSKEVERDALIEVVIAYEITSPN